MAQTNKKVTTSVVEQEIIEANVAEQEQASEVVEQASASNYKGIIKSLIANGCKRVNSIRIKNVNATEKDNYTMISFTLASPIRGYSIDENGNYKLGMTNTLFTSLYAITGAMKEDEDLGWMANTLLQNPQALNLILNGATVDIIQQDIVSGEEYTNPFSTKDDNEPVVYDHDLIINHVIGFKLSKIGQKMSDKLVDKLLGF